MSARDDLAERILAILGGGNAGIRTEWAASMLATRDNAKRLALARALAPDGWIVGKVPDAAWIPPADGGLAHENMHYQYGHGHGYRHGWNACRAAMLASSEETP